MRPEHRSILEASHSPGRWRWLPLALATAMVSVANGESCGWRGDGTGAFADANPPIEWSESKNIAWKTMLPNWGNGSPIVGGGHVYVVCEPTIEMPAPILVCLDQGSGEILWQQMVDVFDAVDAPDLKRRWHEAVGKKLKAQELLLAFQETLRQEDAGTTPDPAEVRRIGDDMAAIGMTAKRRGTINKGPDKGKAQAWGKCTSMPRNLMKEVGRYGILGFNWEPKPNTVRPGGNAIWCGNTFGTPAADEDHVYALVGTRTLAAFTHAGKHRWIVHLPGPDGVKVADQHRSCSVYAIGDRLLCYAWHTVTAVDRTSGRLLWRQDIPHEKKVTGVDGRNFTACVPIEIGGTTYGLLVWDKVYLFDLASGKDMLEGEKLGSVVNGSPGVLGSTICFENDKKGGGMRAYRFAKKGDAITHTLLWDGPMDARGRKKLQNGLHAGVSILGYAGRFWWGPVVDAETGEQFTGIRRGGCKHISPFAAGGRVYYGSDTGVWTVFDAASGKKLAENALQLTTPTGDHLARVRANAAANQWPRFTLSTPIAHGTAIYLRSMDHLYCIRAGD